MLTTVGNVKVNGVESYFASNDEDVRNELLQMVVHTSDLYTPVRLVDEAREWAKRIMAEFHSQTRIEEREGCVATLALTPSH